MGKSDKLRGNAVSIMIATDPLRRLQRGEGQPLEGAGGAAAPLQPPPERDCPHRVGLRAACTRSQRCGGHDDDSACLGLARFGLPWLGLVCLGLSMLSFEFVLALSRWVDG